jgi:hypothetical protein
MVFNNRVKKRIQKPIKAKNDLFNLGKLLGNHPRERFGGCAFSSLTRKSMASAESARN